MSIRYASTSARLGLLVGGLLLTALPMRSADAASWGSFDISRMAYSAGTLNGTVHSELRTLIGDNDDEIAPTTGTLTPEYLATVDVFYTGMLSDGTGPSAGELGTLSLDERAALSDWLVAGGTLVITADSNGFDGPFPIVYESWLADYGVSDFSFVFEPGVGQPVVVHPITEGINAYSLDGTVSFTYPAEGEILGTAVAAEDPLIVVFEPATGFVQGGRILVFSDHNALTDGFIGDLDNLALAQNIVEWASGECGNEVVESPEQCDDGNEDDDDGCSSTCTIEEVGSTGGSGTGDETGDPDSSTGDEPGDTSGAPVGSSSGDDTAGTEGTGDGTSGENDDGGGCGCRSGSPAAPGLLAPLLLALGLRRRRR